MPASQGSNSQQTRFGVKARVIVAIDFGTSHSGYAMMHMKNDSSVEAHYKWKDQPVPYCKDLTAILYRYESPDPMPLVDQCGYTAKKTITRSRADPNRHYLSRFKLYLDSEVAETLPNLPPHTTALSVIADYLSSLHTMAIKDIKDRWGGIITDDSVVWFLTVPAMWTEKAKQEMRKAAVVAGLVSEEDMNNPNRLNIVLEPEAAAMYCCRAEENQLEAGQSFMIVDAGGGTVDLTTHELLCDPNTDEECLREISRGSGKSCGSTFIDEAFVRHVKAKCGAANVDNFIASHGGDWLKMMNSWEEKKRNFADDSEDEESIHIPLSLRRLMAQTRSTDEWYDEDESDNESDNEELAITVVDFRNMFDPIVDDTLNLVEDQLHRSCMALKEYRNQKNSGSTQDLGPCKIDKIFFVGGFSASEYLWKKAQARFGEHVEMLRPVEPGAAVVKGAVYMGKFPKFIGSRRTRIAYGIKMSGPWTPENTTGKKKWNESENAYFAENLFHTIVGVDEQVGVNEARATQFIPVESTQKFVKLELYTTDIPDQKYMSSAMHLAATLDAPLSLDTATQPSTQLPVRMQFVQDVSASMGGEKLKASKEGLKKVCQKLTQGDEVGLIKFCSAVDTVRKIQPYSTPIDSHIDRLEASKVGIGLSVNEDTNRVKLRLTGLTALYDAIVAGLLSLEEDAESSDQQEYQNILFVTTDGEENASATTIDEVSELIKDLPNNENIPNTRIILAIAGSMELNSDLVKVFQSEECKDYCEIIQVADSSEGIKLAFEKVEKNVQLLKSPQHSLAAKVVNLDILFGGTEVTAEVFVRESGVRKSVQTTWHGQRCN